MCLAADFPEELAKSQEPCLILRTARTLTEM